MLQSLNAFENGLRSLLGFALLHCVRCSCLLFFTPDVRSHCLLLSVRSAHAMALLRRAYWADIGCWSIRTGLTCVPLAHTHPPIHRYSASRREINKIVFEIHLHTCLPPFGTYFVSASTRRRSFNRKVPRERLPPSDAGSAPRRYCVLESSKLALTFTKTQKLQRKRAHERARAAAEHKHAH
jgi:hypothetical protein